MISEIHTHEDPILTREEAIEILNTPDDQLDMLIERAVRHSMLYTKECADRM